MGYDCNFQLIDRSAVVRMLAALKANEPPPPSAFDQRDDAASIWATARARIFGDDLELAARTAGQLVAIWSAASLPFIGSRNLAVTYHPLRMEDELKSIPSGYFGSPRRLFLGLRENLSWSGTLDGNATVGGYVTDVESCADALKRFHDTLPNELRPRVLPLLILLRAAVRHRLSVLESSDLLGVPPEHQPMLCWPGLDRSGLEGDALTRDEWRKCRGAGVADSDLDDVLDRVESSELDDRETQHEIALLLQSVPRRDEEFDVQHMRVLRHLQRVLDRYNDERAATALIRGSRMLAYWDPTTELSPFIVRTAMQPEMPDADVASAVEALVLQHSEALTPSLADMVLAAFLRVRNQPFNYVAGYYVDLLRRRGASLDPLASLLKIELTATALVSLRDEVDSLDHHASIDLLEGRVPQVLQLLERAAIEVPRSRESDNALVGLLAQALFHIVDSTRVDDALLELALRVWRVCNERLGNTIDFGLDLDDPVDDVRLPLAIADDMLRGPPTQAALSTVTSMLYTCREFTENNQEWINDFVRPRRDALMALTALGLASRDKQARSDALILARLKPLQSTRWAQFVDDVLAAGEWEQSSGLTSIVPVVAETADLHKRYALLAASKGELRDVDIEALLPLGIDLTTECMRAMAHALRGSDEGRSKLATAAMNLSGALITAGHRQQAAQVTSITIDDVPAAAKPNLLYNQARAYARLNDVRRATDALRAAIALDPQQRDNASRDMDFETLRGDPEFALLLDPR